jgi:hypothetical protein
MRSFFISFFLVCSVVQIFCQTNQTADSTTDTVIDKKSTKARISTFVQTGIIVSTLATLNWAWYNKEPRQSLASFDDSKEWLQMDKVGHTFSTYAEAKLSTALWKWGNYSHKKSVILGSSMAWLYQMSFEVMDGTVATYGFSWTDVAANTAGAGLYAFQQLLWNEERITPKLSYWRQKYSTDVIGRVRQLYGDNGLERFLKDYNGQTHWLSFNLHSFHKNSKLPKWLNIAIGYGAQGMLGGFKNEWISASGDTVYKYDVPRQRQWYFSPDIQFNKIPTKRKGVKILFFVLNSIKFPAPALLLQGGKLKLKALTF